MPVDLVAGSRYRPVPPAPSRLLDAMDDTISEPKILVFDSGLGGLTVLAEIAKSRPDAECIYAADDAGFPYGAWAEAALKARVVEVVGRLIAETAPDCVVIACNTASTLVLPDLRAAYPALPFIGTVPAIKPAAAMSRSKLISVLATPGTVARDYTRALIDSFAADCAVTLVGSTRLAVLAEAAMSEEPIADATIVDEIAPCFVERGGMKTDAIVLACTHYPLLLPRFRALAPWSVAWIDPAPAIARRVDSILRERGFEGGPAWREPVEARFTSGSGVTTVVSRTLEALGMGAAR